jgi:Tfp pilus assembly protein PilE
MKKTLYTQKNNNSGFTLLFAVLVATLVVSIGATIISIALRQTILSGTSRESQYAFYAANTALECAYYWDKIGVQTTEGSNEIVFPAEGEARTANLSDITCSGINITTGNDSGGALITQPWNTSTTDETTFYIIVSNEGTLSLGSHRFCAQAKVKKEAQFVDGVINTVLTTIEAKGYNTCDETNPRRVERGLIQQYES